MPYTDKVVLLELVGEDYGGFVLILRLRSSQVLTGSAAVTEDIARSQIPSIPKEA